MGLAAFYYQPHMNVHFSNETFTQYEMNTKKNSSMHGGLSIVLTNTLDANVHCWNLKIFSLMTTYGNSAKFTKMHPCANTLNVYK